MVPMAKIASYEISFGLEICECMLEVIGQKPQNSFHSNYGIIFLKLITSELILRSEVSHIKNSASHTD